MADNNASGACLLDNFYWHLYLLFDLFQEAQPVQSASAEKDKKIMNLEDKLQEVYQKLRFTWLQRRQTMDNAITWIIYRLHI